MVKVRDIFSYDTLKLAFTQNEEMIQTLAPHAANETLTDRIGLWSFHRCLEDLNLPVIGHSGETLAILPVIVSDQEAGSLSIGGSLP
jgi:hypothetical protein